jgi:hypothetical protein
LGQRRRRYEVQNDTATKKEFGVFAFDVAIRVAWVSSVALGFGDLWKILIFISGVQREPLISS